MGEFLERLKQRKLVQWALAYIAAAFALLQGIDIIARASAGRSRPSACARRLETMSVTTDAIRASAPLKEYETH